MLKRGDKSDDNPVIEAMNATLEAVNNKEIHMNLWLFMGPKVLAYQRKLGSDEVEPPQDDLDRGRSILASLLVGLCPIRFIGIQFPSF